MSAGIRSAIDPWRTLEALSFYRAAMCVAFLALASSDYRPPFFEGPNANLIDAALYLYLFVAALLLVLVRGERPSPLWQGMLHIGIDMGLMLFLVFQAGGVASGMGTLLVTPVAAGSLLFERRLSIAVPAAASLGMLGVEFYLNLIYGNHNESYTQTGMLGAGLFIVAFVGNSMAQRTRESEARVNRAREDIEKLAMLSESVIQKMQAGVVVVDTHGEIELMNRAARELLKAERGQNLVEIAPRLWARMLQWRMDPAANLNTALALENQRSAWVQFIRVGGSSGASLIILDDAQRVSEQAQALKLASLGRLTASIAHELRNPLSAIQNAAELGCESTELAPADRQLMEIIHRQSQRLSEIIGNVLTLSRKPLEPAEPVDLVPLLHQAVSEFESSCCQDCPRIHLDAEPERIPVSVQPTQLMQILGNLLDNTHQHARRPDTPLEVHIRARVGPDGTRALVDIWDNGPGIPTEVERHVFEPFFSTRHQGTGLGLFITRELCHAVHGDLQLLRDDETTAGAAFRLSLPATLIRPE